MDTTIKESATHRLIQSNDRHNGQPRTFYSIGTRDLRTGENGLLYPTQIKTFYQTATLSEALAKWETLQQKETIISTPKSRQNAK
jgi:hypothetical protein